MRHFKVLSSNIYNYHAQRHLLDDFTGLELNQHFPYYFGRSHHIKLPGLLSLPMDGLEPPACPRRMGAALPTELHQHMVDPTGLEPVTSSLQG